MALPLDDKTVLANATHVNGLAAFLAGDSKTAVELLEDTLRQCRHNCDQYLRWMTLFHLVTVHSTLGDIDRADALARECMAMCESQSAYMSRSNALWLAGLARWRRGEQKQAAELVRKGLSIMRTREDRWGIAECLEVLAWIEAADGDDTRAAQLFGAANTAWRAIGTSLPELQPSGPHTARVRGNCVRPSGIRPTRRRFGPERV